MNYDNHMLTEFIKVTSKLEKFGKKIYTRIIIFLGSTGVFDLSI